MTSSFKSAQHASFLPLRLDSLSSHLTLVTRLCVRLVTSNLSGIAIFYPTRCLSDSRRCSSCYISSGSHFLALQVVSQTCECCAPFISSPLDLIWIPLTSLITLMLIYVDGLFLTALLQPDYANQSV